MSNIMYEIGSLDPIHPTELSKFVVYRKDEHVLSLCALGKTAITMHIDVAREYDLKQDDILGGGEYTVFFYDLILNEYSSTFGSIPNEVGERFGGLLADNFRRRGTRIDNVIVSMRQSYTQKNKDVWESLGFYAGDN